MSQQPINHSPDLKKLRDEGYEIVIISGFLVMRNVPFVNSKREVKLADLVSELDLAGDVTIRPKNHVVHFTGEHPCDKNGVPLTKIVNSSSQNNLAEGLIAQHSFSSKPKEGYADYYEKMTTYATILASQAEALDPSVDARTFAPVEPDKDESVFNYLDTASSRAEIVEVTKKLALQKIAIVGLGGTGSYILDFVAKTPVKEIHLYDADDYLSHNAFRSPGAPSLEELRGKPKKVSYFKAIYEKMHRGIIPHDYNIDGSNVDELQDMDFVFISVHGGNEKGIIFKKLEEFGIPFIDVGMGIFLVEESCALGGVLRVTTSTDHMREHAKKKVSFSGEGDGNNEYARNIQIADLNAYNAVMAVIKWKKLFGFYLDFENEHSSAYTIDGNHLTNEDTTCLNLK